MPSTPYNSLSKRSIGFLFWAAFLIGIQTGNSTLIRIAPRIDITQPDEGSPSTVGVIGGVRRCGGPGEIVQMRYEGCTGESPCKIPGDGKRRRSELEFVPSEDINGLGVRFIVITENGSQKVHERPIANSDVKGGERYVIGGAGGPTKEMIGRAFTFQYIIYRVENNNVEICAEADFVVVEP